MCESNLVPRILKLLYAVFGGLCVCLSSDAGKLLILNNPTNPQQCSNLSRKSRPFNKEPLANKKSSAGPTMRSNYFFMLPMNIKCGRPLKILIIILVIVKNSSPPPTVGRLSADSFFHSFSDLSADSRPTVGNMSADC